MISKLKKKFTLLATVSMFLLMAVLILIMNIVNYSSVVRESDATLDVLSQPDAPFFDFDGNAPPKMPEGMTDAFIPRGMSPEVPYESRFFTVTVTSDGKIMDPDFSRIVSIDRESAEEYIQKALRSVKDRGFAGQYRYFKTEDSKMTRIMFLDCGRKLDTFHTFLWTSIGVGLFGCIVVLVVFLFASGKIVKPIAESYEKQKRFISDAGHEIKTPLTIINANVDLLDCDMKREELDEIRHQTGRLTELTNNLVLLSKMEEAEHTIQKTDMPLSDIVSETADSFQAPAASNGLAFSVNIQPQISLIGSPDAIRRLVSILLENAVKYSPSGGAVTLDLTASKKEAVLSVFNTTREKISTDDIPYVFDRFYRTDTSRNSSTGGHGIGLSIAKAIVEAHGGTVAAETKDGFDFKISAVLPL